MNHAQACKSIGKIVDRKSKIPFVGRLYAIGGAYIAFDFDMVATLPAESSESVSIDPKTGNAFVDLPSDYAEFTGPAQEMLARFADSDFFDWQGSLVDDVKAISPGISKEETRYYLNGAYFHRAAPGSDRLAIVATDGHRLYKLETQQPAAPAEEFGVIVPRKALEIIAARKGCQFWKFATDGERYAAFWQPATGFKLVTKLIDGSFPDYWRVIPRESSMRFAIAGDAAAMLATVKGFDSFSAERSKSLKITGADLAMYSPDFGERALRWPATVTGEAVQFGVNQAYIKDVLSTIGKGRACIHVHDGSSPLLITSDDSRFVSVLMPLRV